MKTLLIVIALFFTCTVYASESFHFPLHKRTMTITWESDPVKINKAIKEYMIQNPNIAPIDGLALWKGNKCTIYTLEPQEDYDENMTLLGHETLHCFRGMFHEPVDE